MREAYAGAASPANSRGHETCTEIDVSRTVSPIQRTLAELIKGKVVHKPWAFLTDLCGLKESAAKSRFAAGKSRRDFSVEELQALLHSEEGLDFLVAVMADARPRWWVWALKVMKLADLRRTQHETQQEALRLESEMGAEVGSRRRIRNALDANASLSASLARAETTLGIQRADMDRRADHAPRPNARAPHRPMAAKGYRR